jgi:glycosyltransferase involved in cell wall biosynthesis
MDDNFATYVTRSKWGEVFARFYMRHVYFPAFDHHIAVSERTAAELKHVATGHLVPRGIWIRPMGADVENFSPQKRDPEFRRQITARYDLPQNAFLILYVGRLVPEKNLELLIGTMAELATTGRNFRLLIAGEGISRDGLQRTAEAEIPGKIVFLGHVSGREELAQLYANCDAFVHPNPAEPFGIAPLEAMASGLPLVAPDRGGITTYANDSNAYLVPPTPEAFAHAILTVSRDGTETACRIEAAWETAQTFAWPEVTDSFLHLYDELHRLANGRPATETMGAAFISSPADAAYAERLRFASGLAKATFWMYVRTHCLFDGITLRKHGRFQTQIKDMELP